MSCLFALYETMPLNSRIAKACELLWLSVLSVKLAFDATWRLSLILGCNRRVPSSVGIGAENCIASPWVSMRY